MRKKIYRWHRTLSIIIALPVLCWAISGFMHPVMTNIRPRIATQFYIPPVIDTSQIKVPLEQCLLTNGIDSIHGIHLVQMGGQQFYQVIVDRSGNDNRYFSTRTGQLLKNGDELYARYLARYFLEGAVSDSLGIKSDTEEADLPDCCAMATVRVLNNRGVPIRSVIRLEQFDGEYKLINRLLPVYKVTFERADGIRIYVETSTGKFGFAVDRKRATFDQVFGIFHTWEWMNGGGSLKYVLMVVITLSAFLTTIFGLYLLLATRTKRSSNSLVKARRRHRVTSGIACLFTLMFTLSGAYHAFSKIVPGEKIPELPTVNIDRKSVHPDFIKLMQLVKGNVLQSLGICTFNKKVYWQLMPGRKNEVAKPVNDLMKSMAAPMQEILYADVVTGELLPDGDKQYAAYLAGVVGNGRAMKEPVPVTKFTGEYGFINKRLPVWRVAAAEGTPVRYYMETTTGVLAARVSNSEVAEGLSFSFFHKHHFMDWAGKKIRDASSMFWAGMQVAMILVGLILYRERKKKNRVNVK